MLKHYIEFITHKKMEQIRKEQPHLGLGAHSKPQHIFKIPGEPFAPGKELYVVKNPQQNEIKQYAPRGILTPKGVYMMKYPHSFIHFQIIMYLKENNVDGIAPKFTEYEGSGLYDSSYDKFITVYYNYKTKMFEFGESYSDIFKCIFEPYPNDSYEIFNINMIEESRKFLKALGVNINVKQWNRKTTNTLINEIRANEHKVLPLINNMINKLTNSTGINFDRKFSTSSWDD